MKNPTKIIYITGGATCGKSTYACTRAKILSRSHVTFIATATNSDSEMNKKIAAHQRMRPNSWTTIEIGKGSLVNAIRSVKTSVAIIDCVTMFVSTRLVLCRESLRKIMTEIARAIKVVRNQSQCRVFIIVSNEVGWGLVPEHKLGRTFRETLGTVNKAIMVSADEAFLLVSGFPIRLK